MGWRQRLLFRDRPQDMLFVLLEQTPSERQRIQKAVKQLIYEAMEN